MNIFTMIVFKSILIYTIFSFIKSGFLSEFLEIKEHDLGFGLCLDSLFEVNSELQINLIKNISFYSFLLWTPYIFIFPKKETSSLAHIKNRLPILTLSRWIYFKSYLIPLFTAFPVPSRTINILGLFVLINSYFSLIYSSSKHFTFNI